MVVIFWVVGTQHSQPSLVAAVGGGAGNPQPLPEPAGSGTRLLKEKALPMPPQRVLSGFGS